MSTCGSFLERAVASRTRIRGQLSEHRAGSLASEDPNSRGSSDQAIREHEIVKTRSALPTGFRILEPLAKPSLPSLVAPPVPRKLLELPKGIGEVGLSGKRLQMRLFLRMNSPRNRIRGDVLVEQFALEQPNIVLAVVDDVVKKVTTRERVRQVRLQPREPRVELAVELTKLLLRHAKPRPKVIFLAVPAEEKSPAAPVTLPSANPKIIIKFTGRAPTVIRARATKVVKVLKRLIEHRPTYLGHGLAVAPSSTTMRIIPANRLVRVVKHLRPTMLTTRINM